MQTYDFSGGKTMLGHRKWDHDGMKRRNTHATRQVSGYGFRHSKPTYWDAALHGANAPKRGILDMHFKTIFRTIT
jgi:hypothetical protein